jgi:hypothetical protein
VVHLHLEHRLVQRLLGRFLSQGFLYDEMSRACVCLTDDPVPKVIVMGRLSLYGDRAARLHDELITVAAEWIAPEARGRGRLRPLSETDKGNALDELEQSLVSPRLREVSVAVQERFQAYAAQDVAELLPSLQKRSEVLTERAERKLKERGVKEAKEMQKLLEEQRDRILKRQKEFEGQGYEQLSLGFLADERRQLEADRRHWDKRLVELERETIQEPERIQQSYQVKASRIEPVGLVYLWPVSN